MAQPLPRTIQPPPELPNDPKTSDVLSQWLRTFSLWCRHGFADKLSISTAAPSLMMQTADVPPAVYQLGVTSKPTITLTPIALGSGDPGTPVQIATRADLSGYLPLSGGTVAGNMNVNGNLGTTNFSVSGQTVFYQLAGTIPQATGGSVMVQCPGTGNQAFITFHIPGLFACNFGVDLNGNFYSGGWSFGVNNAYKFWTSRDFANPCDYRSKADVQPLGSTWDVVKALKPISYTNKDFDWVKADGLERWGFIAHELQETLVESAATGVKDEPNRVQSPNMLVVIAALTRALQEAMARIETLEAR